VREREQSNRMKAVFQASAAALVVLFTAVGDAADSFRPTPLAVQTVYRNGVPHTDRNGKLRLDYDRQLSLFPIGIYHGLNGEFSGTRYGFRTLKEAGFNTVLPWRDQPMDTVMAAAADAGLQVIWHDPTDEEAAKFGTHPALLGWDIDHEPSVDPPDAAAEARLERFMERKSRLQAIALSHPAFTINSPSISEPRTALWQAWARAGDLVAFWKYPFFGAPVTTLTGPRGVPEVTALAVSSAEQRKPVLYIAQAFRGQSLDWEFPNPDAARAMVYAALVHGATGVVWFALDSFVTRNDDVLGMHPEPAANYGIALAGGKVPLREETAEYLAESRRMWGTVIQINKELTGLTPVLLSPTSDRSYSVAVAGSAANDTPIRTVLKMVDDGYVLIAVNVDAFPVVARFDMRSAVRDLERLDGGEAVPETTNGQFKDLFAPFAVRIYRLRM